MLYTKWNHSFIIRKIFESPIATFKTNDITTEMKRISSMVAETLLSNHLCPLFETIYCEPDQLGIHDGINRDNKKDIIYRYCALFDCYYVVTETGGEENTTSQNISESDVHKTALHLPIDEYWT
jgi:hypothetical protein